MTKNTAHQTDCIEGMRKMEAGTVDTMIVDGPYFQVKGDFDFALTFGQWQALYTRLAIEAKRLLKDNGTLFIWGDAKNIAYLQMIFDKEFNLLNSGRWFKTEGQGHRSASGKCAEAQRTFAPITEAFLLYGSNSQKMIDIEANNAKEYWKGFEPIRLYLRKEIEKVGLKEASNFLGFKSRRSIEHWTCRSQWYIAPENHYNALREKFGIFQKDYSDFAPILKAGKEAIEKARRYFNAQVFERRGIKAP